MAAQARRVLAARTTWPVAACVVASAAFPACLALVAPAVMVPPASLAPIALLTGYCLALACLVAWHAPGNASGPLIAAGGLAAMITTTVEGDATGPFGGMWMLLYLPFAVLVLVVPDGRPASRSWRGVGWAVTAVVGLFMGLVGLVWVRPGLGGTPVGVLGYALLPVFMGLLVACAAAPVQRYRHAGVQERVRVRWMLMAGFTLPLTLMLCWASYLVLGTPDLVAIGLIMIFLVIPAASAVAVVRPRVLDVDRATLATVTGFVLAALALIILSGIGLIVGQAMIDWSPYAALGTTASLAVLAAATFLPLRRLLDRLLYPERARVLAALGLLRADVEHGWAEPGQVEAVLRRCLGDPHLVVAYRGLSSPGLHTLDGRPVDPGPGAIEVRVRGERVGAILPGREAPPPGAVLAAAAPLVDLARTRAELNTALAEVDASRQRLLRAGYDERRRLERDLHDGAQQRLVALGMQLRVLQLTEQASGPVAAGLDAAVTQLATAVAELRHIAQGMRPSSLDDGLGAALSASLSGVTGPSGPVELDIRAEELPDAVTTTAYFVVNEAVTNALKHADAAAIRVAVRRDGARLTVRIDDDGRGGALPRPSGGLTGLTDRVEAMGGELTVHSPAGSGTTVEAVLPCGS